MLSGKWSCPSCGTVNEGGVAACGKCGRLREAGTTPAASYGSFEPAPDPPAASTVGSETDPFTPPPPVEAPRRSLLGRLVRQFGFLAIIAAVAIGGAVFAARRDDSGQITGAGNLSVFDLRVGDCYDLKDPEADEVGDVDAKPCTEAHEFEVFYVGEIAGSEFPDDDAIVQVVSDQCLPAFDAYVGKVYEESELYVFPITPSEESWGNGDRDLLCSLFHPMQDELTSSLRDSQR